MSYLKRVLLSYTVLVVYSICRSIVMLFIINGLLNLLGGQVDELYYMITFVVINVEYCTRKHNKAMKNLNKYKIKGGN